MNVFTEGRHPAEFVLAEASGNRSRDNIVISAAVAVLVGSVLGFVGKAEGAVTVGNPAFTGTGNGVMTLANPAYGNGVQAGTYTARLVEAGANAGTFEVVRPDGSVDGFAKVGVAYAGQIAFTIADGATDFAADAQFTVAVTKAEAANVGEFAPLDLAANDGTENAAAIALYPVLEDDENRAIAAITRDCTVNGKCLEWPDGITDDQKTAAIAALSKQGIIVR